MKAAALNAPWARSSTLPATIASAEPQPNTTIMNPSWLTVPSASSNLRSVWRSARRPASSIVATPTVATRGLHMATVANAGANLATRYTPALTIVAECR